MSEISTEEIRNVRKLIHIANDMANLLDTMEEFKHNPKDVVMLLEVYGHMYADNFRNHKQKLNDLLW